MHLNVVPTTELSWQAGRFYSVQYGITERKLCSTIIGVCKDKRKECGAKVGLIDQVCVAASKLFKPPSTAWRFRSTGVGQFKSMPADQTRSS